MMTQQFDGTQIEFNSDEVTVTEGIRLTLINDVNLVANAQHHVAGAVRAKSIDQWTADRIVFCFGIARRLSA